MAAIPILASGQTLTMDDISTALGITTNVQRSLDESSIRSRAEKTGSGTQISYNDLKGKLGDFYVSDYKLYTGPASASITFITDGSITFTGNSSPASDLWYKPATNNIGASYWIKCVLTTGTQWTGIANDTILQLNTNRSLSWSINGIGGYNATVNVFIYSDSNGTNLVAKGSITAEVLVDQ